MNKYAENISDVITLDATEEIVDIFLESLEKTDKTTGIIANKEFIEYAMGEALAQDWINVRRVDIELDDLEYMLSVDDNGDLVVQPVIEYTDKYFSSMETVYISMDGDVSQDVIDNCIDRDVNVILFGYEDECDCDKCQCACNEESKPSTTSTATYKVNGKEVDKATYDKALADFNKKYDAIGEKYLDNVRDMLLGYCEWMDAVADLHSMFRW